MPTIQIQLAITFGDDAAKALTELLGPAIRQLGLRPEANFDERREARLRASQNAILAGQKPPEDQGLLIDTKQAAKLLNVSARHFLRMHDAGKTPPAVRIGNAVRWSRDGLKKWVDAGCPALRR